MLHRLYLEVNCWILDESKYGKRKKIPTAATHKLPSTRITPPFFLFLPPPSCVSSFLLCVFHPPPVCCCCGRKNDHFLEVLQCSFIITGRAKSSLVQRAALSQIWFWVRRRALLHVPILADALAADIDDVRVPIGPAPPHSNPCWSSQLRPVTVDHRDEAPVRHVEHLHRTV